MAHNLNENNGLVSFASTQTAWHGLGQIVNEAMTAEQALLLANLNFEVRKKSIICDYEGLKLELEDKCITYRTDNHTALGVVGSRYQILQNKDAFQFFDQIVDSSETIYETAGALGKGERIFICAKMPDYIRIDGTDDMTEVYVLLSNSHDGTAAITAAITPIRVVCQNTLNAALKHTPIRINIKHTINMEHNLKTAHQLLGITSRLTTELNECFNIMAKKEIKDNAAKALIEQLFKSQEKDSTRLKNIKEGIFTSYQTGIGQSDIIGTTWGLYNGITHYIDHEKNYKNADTKFTNILEGEGAKLTQKAFDLLMAY